MGRRWAEVRDIAEAAGVCNETVREWARQGKLPPSVAGFRRRRWRWEDVKHLFGADRVEDSGK